MGEHQDGGGAAEAESGVGGQGREAEDAFGTGETPRVINQGRGPEMLEVNEWFGPS